MSSFDVYFHIKYDTKIKNYVEFPQNFKNKKAILNQSVSDGY